MFKPVSLACTQKRKQFRRIIPAMITTTALVAGLASLELYKLTHSKTLKLESFANTFANLGLFDRKYILECSVVTT